MPVQLLQGTFEARRVSWTQLAMTHGNDWLHMDPYGFMMRYGIHMLIIVIIIFIIIICLSLFLLLLFF